MKKYILTLLAVFLLAIACGGSETPDQVVTNLFNAIKNADGDTIVNCLSAETIVGLDEKLTEIKADPEGTSAMAGMYQIEITPEEVSDLTVAKALTFILSNETINAAMSDISTIEIGEVIIDGETAIVLVTYQGEAQQITLTLEDGKWKIDASDLI